ncbi:D-aminoacyl-tRNA deacylase [Parvimonas micra]|jgi:D-tyrosyl-tRNA(Tyr) deacylase|uniref:D-aminoacyl-tRNA deacylase n=2 Tax=Parvimonas micra TaxID=33033 RepID=A0A0B4S103_9FIRM|nr:MULTISPECIES: D-aminoacyl-tRNA deacylase [Parvimonas]AIZ36483.1 D-tyrosyl-tRNA(Tyr) deacylase [Parvimonas micra]AXU10361.1 D-tyrosyl-tRNA(Tyr) deacylase [Parvimonas micra]EDP23698.1 D-tyrosyl-tRNA(Tyr) deacylase [Parvimonas micra ATCC 33270]MBF1307402.1 D-tyrosyl-tRNA(Tyr) deacylase [Parvimonas micra]MCK6129870.1 D-tyrosyl-tRNA(Tyr) deacylase [Parvimonas micra]
MRVILQRVNFASVEVNKKEVSRINKGLLLFVGFGKDDTDEDLKYIFRKILNLRIFEDQNYKMNLSVLDMSYEILIVSQFTLYGDCRKGNRPSFDGSLSSFEAKRKYEEFLRLFYDNNITVKTGIFQADMKVLLENDGPVTIQLDSKKNY